MLSSPLFLPAEDPAQLEGRQWGGRSAASCELVDGCTLSWATPARAGGLPMHMARQLVL